MTQVNHKRRAKKIIINIFNFFFYYNQTKPNQTKKKVAALLSKQKSEYGIKILASMVTKESDPLALTSVITSCQIQDDILRDAILEVLSRADQLPYRYKRSIS